MNELWIIGVVGGGAGAAIGVPLLARGRADGLPWPVERLAGLWLSGGAVAMLLIGLRHGGVFPESVDRAVEHLTNAANMIAWTLLVMMTRRLAAIEARWPARMAHHLTLPVAYLIVIAALGFPDVRFLWLTPIGIASVVAIAFAWRHARATANEDTVRQASAVFAFAVAYCAAQSVRSVFPRVTELREIVPFVTTAAFFLIGFALAGRRLTSGRPSYRKSALTPDRARALITRVDSGMKDGAWYRDSDLSLASLAARARVSPHTLSQALNQQRGQSLTEYIADWRLREAKLLLLDPANDCLTVEGLAQQAGFASRSSFYKAFRLTEGVTPNQYRELARSQGRVA